MKKTIIMLTLTGLIFAGCGDAGKAPAGDSADTLNVKAENENPEMWNGYRKIDPANIDGNIIKILEQDWMLITAGNEQSYNTMTAGWGGMGRMWEMPVAFMAVKNVRYTYKFLQDNDTYTLSFFGGKHKDDMVYLGTHSGRDGDKVSQTKLTPMVTPLGSMSFSEATMIIECRKIFEDSLNPKSMFDDDVAAGYIAKPAELHMLFIGEMVNVWVK